MGRARLAIDIGGTFTDAALHRDGHTAVAKVLTTHLRPEEGFLLALDEVLAETGTSPGDLELIVHGTTLATNAIIERRGARTALLTTAGFRDVLEIADEGRFDQYDLRLEKPRPLVPRHLRFAVRERVDARGEVLLPLDEQDVLKSVRTFSALGVEAVAICFLHAFRNPHHERLARDLVAALLPDVPVSLSSEVAPEIREYERFSTTCANAYVRPLMDGYLGRLAGRLAARGIGSPLLLMTSAGSLATVETARAFPIRLVESGPAGGAILASCLASDLGLERALSFDMGGTTAKVCLVDAGEPEGARSFEVARTARFRKGSGLPLRIPVIEMIEIGAGGGSIAGIDQLERVTVGPKSAESEPGPACYGRGGSAATVTDSDLLLGRLDATAFARRGLQVDARLAASAVREAVAEPMGLSERDAAFVICETVDETMANAARVYAVERGRALEDYSMIAFGGSAPLHVSRLAEKLGIRRIVIPPSAGVGSALGFLCAPIAYEAARSLQMRLDDYRSGDLLATFEQLADEAHRALEQAADGRRVRTRWSLDMRYIGQGHEIPVDLEGMNVPDALALQERFEQVYEARFGRRIDDGCAEILTQVVRLDAGGALELSKVVSAQSACGNGNGQRCAVYLAETGELADIPVYRRDRLASPAEIPGPCLITETTTSTFVGPAFVARVDAKGNLILISGSGRDSD